MILYVVLVVMVLAAGGAAIFFMTRPRGQQRVRPSGDGPGKPMPTRPAPPAEDGPADREPKGPRGNPLPPTTELGTPPTTVVLEVTGGPDRGRRFVVYEGNSTLGRDPECLVRFSDASVSAHQCILQIKRGQVLLFDHLSTNGTFVNGRRLEEPLPLSSGDTVQLGETVLIVRLQDGADQGGSGGRSSTVLLDSPAIARQVAWLIVAEGPDRGRSTPLTPWELTVGRLQGALQIPSDKTMSREHLTVRVTPDGQIFVSDRHSRNGTQVNGQPINREVQVGIGDSIRLGQTILKVATTPPDGNAAATSYGG